MTPSHLFGSFFIRGEFLSCLGGREGRDEAKKGVDKASTWRRRALEPGACFGLTGTDGLARLSTADCACVAVLGQGPHT